MTVRRLPLLRWIKSRKTASLFVLTLIVATFAVSVSGYEFWRSSVQSQIQGRIDFMNIGDPICSYIISNSFVMPYYEGKVIFFEGGTINKTQFSNWQSVTDYAYSQLNNNRTQLGCKIWFGLTRTLLVLLGHTRENNLRITQDVLFASYAPL
jgi:hypothetical protein